MFDPSSPPPRLYNGQPCLFHGEYHISNPPKELAEGIWLAHATGSCYVHVDDQGNRDNWWYSYYDLSRDSHWCNPENTKSPPRFKKGDLVKYVKRYNNYGNCLATQMTRTVVEYLDNPHPKWECWDGHTDPHWYILDPEGHHWCDPEHGLELVTEDEEG